MRFFWALGLTLFLAISCATNAARPLVIPMPVDSYYWKSGETQDTALVFLIGLGDKPANFVDHGFVAELQASHRVDVFIPDAHLAYYENGSILDRLDADVLAPIRTAGYRHVWLVGVSMGGGGSLLAAREWPDQVDGVVMIAPFLGDQNLIQEIGWAGGAAKWDAKPQVQRGPRDEQFRSAWRWLKSRPEAETAKPLVYLAYGKNDRFVIAHDLLAPLLPADRVYRLPGGHNWKTWKTLWSALLKDLPLGESL